LPANKPKDDVVLLIASLFFILYCCVSAVSLVLIFKAAILDIDPWLVDGVSQLMPFAIAFVGYIFLMVFLFVSRLLVLKRDK
jgi:hypothetical protein